MIEIVVITPVPQSIKILVENSILRKALEKNIVKLEIVNLREFGLGRYKKIDDKPYGGLHGMVLMAKPLNDAIEYSLSLFQEKEKDVKIIYPTPQGKNWNQNTAFKFSKENKIIFICGHYKGIDERIIKKYVPDEYSIGDFVMTCGEIPVMVMLDSIIRLVPGTLNNIDSALTDSHSSLLLDNPYYTYPRKIFGYSVPKVLLSGHHSDIKSWQINKKKEVTRIKRPDIYKKYQKLIKLEKKYE